MDRAEALAAISRGYSLHAFGYEEYRDRVKRANEARTREELYLVVRDLELDGTLPEDYDAKTRRSGSIVPILVLLVLILLGVIAVLAL